MWSLISALTWRWLSGGRWSSWLCTTILFVKQKVPYDHPKQLLYNCSSSREGLFKNATEVTLPVMLNRISLDCVWPSGLLAVMMKEYEPGGPSVGRVKFGPSPPV